MEEVAKMDERVSLEASLGRSKKKQQRSHPRTDDEERPLTAKERAEEAEAGINLIAVTHLMEGLRRIDEARADLSAVSDELYRALHSIYMPDVVRDDFERFWKSGGCTSEHYRNWVNGKLAKEPVPARKHLRVVFSQKHRTSRIQLRWRQITRLTPDGDPPEAA
jgi:hypothetical protein